MKKDNPLFILEEERKRIAGDLHDTTVQELVHLLQQIDLAGMYLDTDINQSRLELFVAKKNIRNIIEGIRDTIYDLRPMTFDDIGWNATFERMRIELEKYDISVIFNIEKPDNIDETYAITLYRIIRESCINAVKYSECTKLVVTMYTHNQNIHITIRDNGKGFDVNSIDDNIDNGNHFGLKLMIERIKQLFGVVDFESNSSGTSINIVIPY